MEKIQSALAKARAERGTATPRTNPGPASPRAPAPDADILEAWEALPQLTLAPRTIKRNRIVALGGGREATGIDMMRTRVLQQMRDNNWRRLAITSPTAACGKSTIALNLAMSLQRQPDLRTMLIELDWRRPSLDRMLGIERHLHFAQVLSGTAAFGDNAVRYGRNLAIASNHTPMRDAAELLGSPSVPQVLGKIEADYAPDIVIFDTPPMLVTDDMMAFARHVDCVLLVAGAEATSVKEIDVCEQDLASQTNVMGVVLNKCRYMGEGYDYGYYE
jgi:Mrp family chromosome partitioning ATPase